MTGEGPGRESGAPRGSTLLRAVQRGDYGVLTNLFGSSNGEDHDGNANLGLVAALLVEACGREHLDCMEFLLQKMMRPSPKRNLKRRGYFPMHAAAGAGATESIELLLSAGLSPKTRDRSGRTPLHLAAAQGSAKCVSLLCAVARSTVLSRDRATGDTPVHFAVRARNGVCIEVLLSHAPGDCDILRETNAKGETPLDIAAALGDTSLVLRPGRAAGGERRTRSEGGVDIQRIMAVWERFFENAAVACIGGRDTTRALGIPSRTQHDQLASGHHQTTSVPYEVGDRVRLGERPGTALTSVWEVSARRNDVRVGDDINIGSGDEEKGWSGGEANVPNLAAGIKDRQLPGLLPGTPFEARARISAWEAAPTDPVGDHEGKLLCDVTLQQPTPLQRTAAELYVQLENDESILSSDDVDLHLFQTPRGGSDAEVVWLSESQPEDIHSISEPPSNSGSSAVAAVASGSPSHFHQRWVACWDATSESIYYWDSKSGELSWNAPASTDEFDEVQCRVWDPQREAFFAVDEGGTAHWLAGSTIGGRAAIDDAISLGTAISSEVVANHGRADRDPASLAARSSRQGFGSSTKAAEGSLSIKGATCRGNLHGASSEEGGEEIATGGVLLHEETEPKERSLRSSLHSVAGAGFQPVGRLPDGFDGFAHSEGQRSRGISNLAPQKTAVQEYEIELAAVKERPLSINTAAAFPANDESAGEEDKSDGVEFFDSRTCEDHCQLSAWVLWCTAPSRYGEDEPPYFVNEETGRSSWVLPPAAVATSRGWLRAWSEEHHAWFYANQRTGTVTWELEELEIEGVFNCSPTC